MTVFWFSLRATLRRLLLPLVIANAAAWFCLSSQPPIAGAGEDAAAVGRLWLHVPALLLTVVAVTAALDLWPLLSRDRPGADLLRRLHPGPLDGCGAVAAGAWVALAAVLAPTGISFYGMLQAQGFPADSVRAHIALQPREKFPLLGSALAALHFDLPPATVVDGLRLNPQAIVQDVTGYAPVDVEVVADGVRLVPQPVRFGGNYENIVLRFAPRVIESIELRTAPRASLALWFHASDSIEAFAPGARSLLANAILAAITYLVPAALMLACACAVRAHLALPVSLALGAALLLIGTLFDLTPNAAAVTAFAADRWLGTENLLARSLPSVSMTVAVLLLATLGLPGRGSRCPTKTLASSGVA